MHGFRRPRPYKGTRKRGYHWPGYWGKSVTPDHVYGKSYFEYTVGESGVWRVTQSTPVTENDITLKAGQTMQTVNTTGTTEAPAWSSIQLNSPLISYQGPAGWSGTVLAPVTLENHWQSAGWNDIHHWVTQYKYMCIYNTYCKVTFLHV